LHANEKWLFFSGGLLVNTVISRLLIVIAMITSTISARAQSAMTAHDSDNTNPSYDMKAQSLLDLEVVQKKFVDLANAIPADRLTWRPSADSRSFAEVLLHVSGERYGILALMGATPPAGFDAKTYEKSTTDRDRIVEELKKSWDFTQKTINSMSNAEFAKLLPKIGPQANAGDVVYILVADAHEHLGQCVAYARENGIVPPWTVEAQKRQAQKAAQKK
jgi:uncharacterized damage-inducible protein DinB